MFFKWTECLSHEIYEIRSIDKNIFLEDTYLMGKNCIIQDGK